MTDDPVIKVVLKHEGEENGEPYGPVVVVTQSMVNEQGRTLGRPYDPNRKPDPWLTLTDAEKIADEHGVPLEQS